MEGPEILKSGAKSKLAQLKKNKAAERDGIVELLAALDDFGIKQ